MPMLLLPQARLRCALAQSSLNPVEPREAKGGFTGRSEQLPQKLYAYFTVVRLPQLSSVTYAPFPDPFPRGRLSAHLDNPDARQD